MLPWSKDSKPHIVVVDDDPDVAEVVCSILEDAFIHATAFTISSAAYASIHANPPDAVILDVQMPQVTGIELFEQLQGDAETRMIPVIFVGADPTTLQPHLSKFNALGVRLLHKPFTGDELLAMVTAILRLGA